MKKDYSRGRIRPPALSKRGIFEDFSGGVDPDKWVISTQKWGGLAIDNHPMFVGNASDNVSFTKDGILLLRCTGNFSDSRTRQGELSGAVIVNKTPMGPGRYEVAMKALPRLGACNGLWTFYYDNKGEVNHEIDYEIPGHPVPNSRPTTTGYDRTLASSWIHEPDPKTSGGVITPTPANDGQWHLYRFDWHTYPTPKVDFFIDGLKSFSSYTHIPDFQGYLHIGAWLPRNWCGQPDFEEDYMLIDWFNYTPFEGHPSRPMRDNYPPSINYEKDKCKYPRAPIDYPERDYISNRHFNGVNSAWKITGKGGIEAVRDKHCLKLRDGAEASQKIEEVYGGYRFNFIGHGKVTKGTRGRFAIEYYTYDNILLDEFLSVDFTSSKSVKSSLELNAPAGCNYLIVKAVAANDSTVSIDKMSLKMILPEPIKQNKLASVKSSSIIKISTEAELLAIADNLNRNYELTNDITLTTVWVGLGEAESRGYSNGKFVFTSGNGFKGHFNGKGHIIKNFNSDGSFFKQIEAGAVVENLGIEGGASGVYGSTLCAPLAGINLGTVKNCSTDVFVNFDGGSPAGAIVADNRGWLLNCYAIGQASSKKTPEESSHGSGLTGINRGTINFCYVLDTAVNADVGQTRMNYDTAYRVRKDQAWLKTKNNFIKANWSPKVWILKDGKYPKLK